MECAFGMNQCATVNYEVEVNIPSLKKLGLKVKATQAMCTTTALNCQICSVIKRTLKMSSILKCDVSFIVFVYNSLVITIQGQWAFLVKVSQLNSADSYKFLHAESKII